MAGSLGGTHNAALENWKNVKELSFKQGMFVIWTFFTLQFSISTPNYVQ